MDALLSALALLASNSRYKKAPALAGAFRFRERAFDQ
jgi:hypothetical protein